MPLPPPLTEEQRREALEKAAIARRRRADLKDQLKSGRTTLKELLGRTDDTSSRSSPAGRWPAGGCS